MKVVERIEDIRAACDAARAEGATVGLVPTMGAFHAGHRSLMRTARHRCDLVVVSLFVNPTQFGPTEDLAAYPRDPAGDALVAESEGVDLVFAPTVDEMYPDGPPPTTVHVAGLTAGLCGAARPTHFDGVTTIVTKLFSIIGPSSAFFGRKDYQQLAVIRQMTCDLNLPVEVVGCPLVREVDGVAMSSRNAYLDTEERRAAMALSRSLRAAAAAIAAGERAREPLEGIVRDGVGAEPLATLEYAELRDARTLAPIERIESDAVLALVARVGRARLLDNIVVTVAGQGVDVDLGVVADAAEPGDPEEGASP